MPEDTPSDELTELVEDLAEHPKTVDEVLEEATLPPFGHESVSNLDNPGPYGPHAH